MTPYYTTHTHSHGFLLFRGTYSFPGTILSVMPFSGIDTCGRFTIGVSCLKTEHKKKSLIYSLERGGYYLKRDGVIGEGCVEGWGGV